MLTISNKVRIPDSEIDMHAIRAQGHGGQNVNKVSTAIHLRFDIRASSLPIFYKERLLALRDHRISHDGVINIKAQSFRSQERNREDAIHRLRELIQHVTQIRKKRILTKPTKASQKRRLERKSHHGKTKSLRKKVQVD